MIASTQPPPYYALRVCPLAEAPEWWASTRQAADRAPLAIQAILAGRTRVEVTAQEAAAALHSPARSTAGTRSPHAGLGLPGSAARSLSHGRGRAALPAESPARRAWTTADDGRGVPQALRPHGPPGRARLCAWREGRRWCAACARRRRAAGRRAEPPRRRLQRCPRPRLGAAGRTPSRSCSMPTIASRHAPARRSATTWPSWSPR